MKTALLIDDEHYCNETLAFELKRCNYDVKILEQCNDPRQGKALIESLSPDILFLDIEMPWLSGFDLLDSLSSKDFHLVFVTAYDKFALKAFDYFALNYLLKPVNIDDLNATLKRIYSLTSQPALNLTTVLDALQKTKKDDGLIALPIGGGYELFAQSEIIRCEADSNYSTIYFESRKPLLVSKPLKLIEDLLDDRFYRIHQSHLINTKKLRRVEKSDGGHIVLKDGSKVPISRMKKTDFLNSMTKL